MSVKNNVAIFLGYINIAVAMLLTLCALVTPGLNILNIVLLSNSAYAVGYTLMCLGFLIQGLALLWIGWD
jgi:hypothetical protein